MPKTNYLPYSIKYYWASQKVRPHHLLPIR